MFCNTWIEENSDPMWSIVWVKPKSSWQPEQNQRHASCNQRTNYLDKDTISLILRWKRLEKAMLRLSLVPRMDVGKYLEKNTDNFTIQNVMKD